MFFHAGFNTFSGGFVGVDIFFVISGYLISGILFSELETGRFSLAGFYERRARRILPALFTVLFSCLLFAWFWLLPKDLTEFSLSLASVPVFISNIFFWQTSGYFSHAAELHPLLHTWSLALEEQYYLFFPLLLTALWRFGRQRVLTVFIVIFLISLAAAEWVSARMPSASFYLLPTRIWELLAGVFAAFFLRGKPFLSVSKTVDEAGSSAGLFLLLYSFFVFDNATPFPGIYALIPVVGTVLIILFANRQTFTGRFLGTRVLTGLGLISYSAYLWHQPLLAFYKYRSIQEPGPYILGSLVFLAIFLAYFSWKYIEKPFRDRSIYSRKKIFFLGLTGSLFFIAVGLAGYMIRGYESRLNDAQRKVLNYLPYMRELTKSERECFARPEQSYDSFPEACKASGVPDAYLLWGDSHAATFSFGFRKKVTHVAQYTASSCPPFKDAETKDRVHCREINDYVMKEIAVRKFPKIFLLANWSEYPGGADSIRKTIEYIKQVSPSSEVTVIGSLPQWHLLLPVLLIKTAEYSEENQYRVNPELPKLRALDSGIAAEAAAAGASFLSALDILCREDKCLTTISYEGEVVPTACDKVHLTEASSLFIAEKFFDAS